MSWVHMRSPPTSPNMRVISSTGTAVRARPTAWVPTWARGPWIQPSQTATWPAGSAETSSSWVTGMSGPPEPLVSAALVVSEVSVLSWAGSVAAVSVSAAAPSGSSWPTGRQ